jgi:hypothetical protein
MAGGNILAETTQSPASHRHFWRSGSLQQERIRISERTKAGLAANCAVNSRRNFRSSLTLPAATLGPILLWSVGRQSGWHQDARTNLQRLSNAVIGLRPRAEKNYPLPSGQQRGMPHSQLRSHLVDVKFHCGTGGFLVVLASHCK